MIPLLTEPDKIFYCDYCEATAVGLGIDEDKQLVPVCHGHRGAAERLLPIPPKWERKPANFERVARTLQLLAAGRITKRAAIERIGDVKDVDAELRRIKEEA